MIHAHGSIGPSCAISEFVDGKLISWLASQATHNLRKQLALMFSMPLEDVRCVFVDGSGCYGGCQLISTLCQSARSA
jgi:nicotinate dehydrogenase subunit B